MYIINAQINVVCCDLWRLPCMGGVAQNLMLGQRLYWPALLAGHLRHGTPGSIATRSPTATLSTPCTQHVGHTLVRPED